MKLTGSFVGIESLDELGYVELVDSMGDDIRVAEAARLSFDRWDEELEQYIAEGKHKNLIQYLAEHNHWTPFGHPQISVKIKMPIFVARQWMKSNIGIVYNEVSRRYVKAEPQFYWPVALRGLPEGSIKQGSSGVAPNQEELLTMVSIVHDEARHYYNALLEGGVAPEQARMVLPLSTYTTVVMTGSLAAMSRVCHLRCKPDAQKEIQDYGNALKKILFNLFPISMEALGHEKAD